MPPNEQILRGGCHCRLPPSSSANPQALSTCRKEALGRHLFLVSEGVDPAELEGYATSMWDDAGWLAPGRSPVVRMPA